MQYLYDIWVNWFDGEEEGFNVCSYHEWRKEDKIEMVDQIPVLYISKELFNQIENGLVPLPNKLLPSIYKKTYIRKGYGRQVMLYAAVLTDGENVLAIDTLGYDIPFRKSRLIPRQERQVYEMCEKATQRQYQLKKEQLAKPDYEWQLRKQHIVGLTRRERQLKKVLLICLAQLRKTDNKKEISYWLSEWKGTNALIHTRKMSIDEIWHRLYEHVISGWTENHERFLRQLVRGYPILKHEWEKEHFLQKNKENQKGSY